MRYFTFCLILLIHFYSFSQGKFSKEFSFINDNDLYVSLQKDRYYTNGGFITFRYLSDTKNKALEKRIIEWQLGHEMYSPYKVNINAISLHDRPFAAHLYGSFGIDRVYKRNQILRTSIQLGVLGPAAYGKELQDFIHQSMGYISADGWKHQIQNSLAFNFNASYHKQLVKDASKHLDITWTSSGKIGTIYSSVSSGFYGRIGFNALQDLSNSIAFNTSLNNDTTNYAREAEAFLYIKPTFRYAFYDATLQGSFLNSNNDVTKELIPLVFNLEIGIRFTSNRFNFGYAYHYHTNKSKGLRNKGNKFGSITINYLFR